MASSHVFSSLVLLTLASCLLFLQLHPTNADSLLTCRFDKIYNFGDSFSDTGNLIREKPIGNSTAFARLPFGETFFKNATGRCSNGLLIIDFIANASGLPFLKPYLEKDANFTHGVNFAVAGATALSKQILANKNLSAIYTNSSLEVQLGWMSEYFNSTCNSTKDCLEKQRTALFVLGELGENDYTYAFLEGKTLQEVINLVPEVVTAIKSGIKRLIIRYGAVRVVVPGRFPMGCSPQYLTLFQTNNSYVYDKHGCLKVINALAIYHNIKLQEAILDLKREYPNVTIVYADYYHAFQSLLDHAVRHGFDGNSTLKACCGIGGEYNYNLTRFCSSEVPVCPNPRQFISWDGIHLTQAAYIRIAKWLIDDMLPKLKCSN